MTPIISIIVPVYNAEEYLERCVRSLTAQILEELEILLVDDGSTDGSGALCDRLAGTDPRIRVLHKTNGGLSSARNAGLDAASGQYVMFVDSDDWVEPDFCSLPYRLAGEHGADLVLFQLRKEGDVRPDLPDGPEFPDGLKTTEEALALVMRMSVTRTLCGPFATNKLYRRELFRDVRYPVGAIYEDIGVTHRLVLRAERIWYCGRTLYCYYRHPGSITARRSKALEEAMLRMTLLRADDLEAAGYDALARDQRARFSLRYLTRVGPDGESGDECLRQLRRLLREPGLSRKRRLHIRLWLASPRLQDAICRIRKKRLR